MTSLIMAWLVGEGLIVWRAVGKQHRPPLPAELLVTSGLFVLLALLAEKDARLAGLLAWGFVVAAWVANPPTKIAPGTDTSAASALGSGAAAVGNAAAGMVGGGSAGNAGPGSGRRIPASYRPPASGGPSAAALSA